MYGDIFNLYLSILGGIMYILPIQYIHINGKKIYRIIHTYS